MFNFETATLDDIYRLKENSVIESDVLEYKQQLNLKKEEKKQLLSEVCSFANSKGGIIIVGIEEDRNTGFIKDVCGIEISNIDAYTRQLSDIVRTSISPIIQLSIKFLHIEKDRYVVLIKTPKGNKKPYLINYLNGFYIRDVVGKRPMQLEEIRDYMFETQYIRDRMIKFVNKRMSKLRLGIAPARKQPIMPKIFVICVPFSAFTKIEDVIQYSSISQIKNELTPYITAEDINFKWFQNGFSLLSDSNKDYMLDYIHCYDNGILECGFLNLVENNILKLNKLEISFQDLFHTTLPNFTKSIKCNEEYVIFINLIHFSNIILETNTEFGDIQLEEDFIKLKRFIVNPLNSNINILSKFSSILPK